MMLDQTIRNVLDGYASDLEEKFEGDVLAYIGLIFPFNVKDFRNEVEKMAARPNKRDRLVLFLTTSGGSAEATENMVDVMRHHYDEVFIVVPDEAKSAGTILCMSADRIFMDYSSSLGPIDPQVVVQEAGKPAQFVPALGYLDKANELVEKARNNTITSVEFEKFLTLDLAMLRRYEQARDLSTELLKRWLVRYKFKNWEIHGTDVAKMGQPVSNDEREERAEEIAKKLSDHTLWHSHGRRIGINTLVTLLRLQIDDYGIDVALRHAIRLYNDVMEDYVMRQRIDPFIHSANTAGGTA